VSTTNEPKDTAAADNPNDPVSLTPPAALDDRRTPNSSSLVGANLVMVLAVVSSQLGTLFQTIHGIQLLLAILCKTSFE
jgi:hypothetical protein